MNPLDSMFTEKYRPKQLDNVVGDHVEKIQKYLEQPGSMPHFLFHSKAPGTGKTTTALAIIKELGCDVQIINSSDDRKIETVREKVKQFAMTQSTNIGQRRCIFLDEIDGMLKASQDALRNIMETYAGNVFFILTCNNINKVIEAIQSRCKVVPFAYPKKADIKKYLITICGKEEMEYDEKGIDTLIEMHYPSIRNCVVTLQDLKTMGHGVFKNTIKQLDDLFEDMWKTLKEKDWKKIKEVVLKTEIDPRELNTYYWQKAVVEDDIKLIQHTCRNERDFAMGADPKVIFVTSIIEMCK